jgi:GDP-L-fucose synthase
MNTNDKVLVLGARGMVGSAICRQLQTDKSIYLLTPTHKELDLCNQKATQDYFETHRPSYVFMCAAKVGGIHANDTFRADFLIDNLAMATNVMKFAHQFQVKRLQYLGSSCIYPRSAPQPIDESSLLTGELERTNEPYALAKIAGLKMAENYRRQYGHDFHSLMPTNLYGPGDNYHPENSHVIPGLIRRMYETLQNGSSEFEVWGTGTPRREFLHVDDLARACIQIMRLPKIDFDWINVGYGTDVSINELAQLIAKIMGFKGTIKFNTNYPDGTPRKLLNTAKITKYGWKPSIDLETGLKQVIDDYKNNLRRA